MTKILHIFLDVLLFPYVFCSQQDRYAIKGVIKVHAQKKKKTNYNFIHIPKTAGSMFLHHSAQHMPIGDAIKGNKERTFNMTPGQPEQMVVFLRDPVSHVFSQFLECKFDSWGRAVTKGTNFPGYGQFDDIYAGFSQWLQHFLKQVGPSSYNSFFKCYNPWNMQSRYFVKKGRGAQYVRNELDRIPPLEEAKRVMSSIGVVGIMEHYSASVCLFEYKTLGYLTDFCHCDNRTHALFLTEWNKGKRISHGVPSHDIGSVDKEIVTMAHALVEIDTMLYKHAMLAFKRKLRLVEKETGVDLLCNVSRLGDSVFAKERVKANSLELHLEKLLDEELLKEMNDDKSAIYDNGLVVCIVVSLLVSIVTLVFVWLQLGLAQRKTKKYDSVAKDENKGDSPYDSKIY